MLLSSIMTNFQPMAILVMGSWKLICCPCEALIKDEAGNPVPNCTTSGRTMPPWGTGEMRECHGDGNWFWTGDTSRCTGQDLACWHARITMRAIGCSPDGLRGRENS